MSKILGKALHLVITSPFTLIAWAWTVLMISSSVALTLGVVMILFELYGDLWRQGVDLKGVGMVAFFTVFFFGGAAFTYYITWHSAIFTWSLTRTFGDHVRDVAHTTRDVFAEREEEEARLEAQGGQISLSVGDGSGGGLSAVTIDEDGLELVPDAVGSEEAEEDRAVQVDHAEA